MRNKLCHIKAQMRVCRTVFATLCALNFANGLRAEDANGRWVGTWSAAPQRVEPRNMPPAPELADATLRQVVHVSLGGKRLRVRISNAYGTHPLVIEHATIAIATGRGAIRSETRTPVVVSGQAKFRIPPGAMVVSDAIDFALAPLSDLAITLHVKDTATAVTGHPGSRATSYLKAGDAVDAPELPRAITTAHWYYLSGVDVETDEADARAVAILGDSITDGRGSITDANGRWPDHLAMRLLANPATASVGVLNQGLGGNRLLNDGLGPCALARLDRDVLAQPGVRDLILLEGINDLGTRSANAAEIIAAYQQIIRRAHDRGIRVFGCTLLPCEGSFYFTPALEAARQEINTWIRSAGHFDGLIDLDKATRDPEHPARLLPRLDSGDHLHPSAEGHRLIAEGVGLELFTVSP